ncbi:hypothetical protein ACQEVI_23995 [Promicromonospora sp. CA-289599]|uniref:hypothetical protein n=1 Tax=Promicromonospora sp. CA-289599 TaxID=3240014 RepID=UPI003D8A54AD
MPGQVRVVIPAGAVSAPGTLEVTPVSVSELTMPPGEGVGVIGAWEIQLKDAELTGTASIEFRARGDDDLIPAGAAYVDEQTGHWHPYETDLSESGTNVVAQVDHFSVHLEWGWVKDKLRAAVGRTVNSFGRASGADQPTCPDEDGLRSDGASVVSDSGTRVKWCAGREGDQQVLKIANARNYPVEVYHGRWTADEVQPSLGLFDTVVHALDDQALPGPDVFILGPGQTAVFTAPLGTTETVTIDPSILGWSLGGIMLGVEVYTAVTRLLPSAIADQAVAAEEFARLLERPQCLDGFTGLFRADTEMSAANVADITTTAVTFTVNCLSGVAVAGVAGWAIKAVAAAASAALTAVEQVVSGMQILIEPGSDRNGYQVKVTYAATEWALTAQAIGPVRLGMTASELQALNGIALDTSGAEIGSRGFQPEGAQPGVAGFARGIDEIEKVCAFLPDPYFSGTVEGVGPTRGLVTETGARLGHTSAELEAIYPDGEWADVWAPWGTVPRFVVAEDGLFMSFGTTGEYVTEVAISTHDQPIGCVEN